MPPKTTVLSRKRFGKNSETEMVFHYSEVPDQIASFAMNLMERWGMVSAEPDGEDSAGRSKLRLSTPQEVVSRACQVSQLAFQEFADRGWLAKAPTTEELDWVEK
jgi:hypothetical protein